VNRRTQQRRVIPPVSYPQRTPRSPCSTAAGPAYLQVRLLLAGLGVLATTAQVAGSSTRMIFHQMQFRWVGSPTAAALAAPHSDVEPERIRADPPPAAFAIAHALTTCVNPRWLFGSFRAAGGRPDEGLTNDRPRSFAHYRARAASRRPWHQPRPGGAPSAASLPDDHFLPRLGVRAPNRGHLLVGCTGPADDPVASTSSPSDDPLPVSAVTTRSSGSLIALSHKHHDRANLSVGGQPQLSYRS
jgi:hypothetical protein